jgi:uncharacterized protein
MEGLEPVSEAPAEAETRLIDEARRHVGAVQAQRRSARDDVNVAMINHWADALDDRNPAYTDPQRASQTRHGGIIAPPAMLGTWTMDGNTGAANVWEPRPPAGENAVGEPGPRDHVLRGLEQAGYTAVVATNYEQTYLRQLRPGDRLSETLTVEDLSERKDTALGTGYFVTVRHDYLDADNELVGIARMRLLKFKPPDRPRSAPVSAAPQSAPRRPRPPINRDNAFFWDGVDAGELRIQRCTQCGALRHPPRPMCGSCQSTEFDVVVSSGRGTIYSYAVHHHPPLPGIDLPLVVILVELEEGVRIVSSLDGATPEAVAIGLPVEVVFTQVDEDLTLPLFRLVERGAA